MVGGEVLVGKGSGPGPGIGRVAWGVGVELRRGGLGQCGWPFSVGIPFNPSSHSCNNAHCAHSLLSALFLSIA